VDERIVRRQRSGRGELIQRPLILLSAQMRVPQVEVGGQGILRLGRRVPLV